MRDEGGEFGGEVSGHYYFKAFYNADSGTIPALLILELLSKRETTLAELLDELRSTYFISGEINSTVDDQRAKMDEIKARLRRRRDHRARRRLDRLRRLALQRAPVEHRAAAAAEPREPRVAAGHGAAARRGARADPLVIHRLSIPTPFRVGPVNCYLIEDDPLTLVDVGPNSGSTLVALEERAARARPPDRGPRADRHHPPAHRPSRAGRRARRALGRRGLRARPAGAGGRGLQRLRRPQRRAGAGADAPPRDRPGRRHRAGRGLARLPRLGRQRAGHAACCTTAASWSSPAARSRCSTVPGTRPATRCSTTRRTAS